MTLLISRQSFFQRLKDAIYSNQDNRKKYLNMPFAYDCEASSFVGYDGLPVGLLYAWAFGAGENVTYGRSVEDFVDFLYEFMEMMLTVNIKSKPIIYVHNLQYDISFLYKYLPFDKMFLVKSRKVLYATCGSVVFRDSLLLSGGRSLNTIGNELRNHNVRKMVGDLDYDLVRSPETPMTETELGYLENDVRVLLAYIEEKIDTDGSIANIPLTNTGYVRRSLRDSVLGHYQKNANNIDKLVMSPRGYWVMKQAQAGGFTHGAQRYVGKVLKNVGSFDIKSSYPAVILTEYYPMSADRCVDRQYANEHLEELCGKYCVTFIAEIRDVVTKYGHEYILSESSVVVESTDVEVRNREISSMSITTFNGRIITAKWIRYAFSELDWDSFKKFYDYSSYEVIECFVCERGKLPKDVVVPMMDWFSKKTNLDGVKDMEIQYMISKNMLNAMPGCMEMDPVRNEYLYDTNERVFLPPVKPDIKEAVEKTNDDNNRFLYFPWGVYVLAHARHKLLDVVCDMGADHVYSDTDSDKVLNYEQHLKYFKEYNERYIEKLYEAGRYYNIPEDVLIPKKPNGDKAILGVFEYEGFYKRFKTLGAKRYLVEKPPKKDKDYSVYQLTAAGVNKQRGMEFLAGASFDHWDNKGRRVLKDVDGQHTEEELREVGTHTATRDPFPVFELGLEIPPGDCGRITLQYIDEPRCGCYEDYLGNKFNYYVKCGVYAKPTPYKLKHISGEEELLERVDRLLSMEEGDAAEA